MSKEIVKDIIEENFPEENLQFNRTYQDLDKASKNDIFLKKKSFKNVNLRMRGV
jgi:hypothetical protein